MTANRMVPRFTLILMLATAAGLTASRFPLASAASVPATPVAPVTSASIVATRANNKIKDLVTNLVVNDDETNRDELKKIGGAFATTYSVKRMHVSYKFPNRARFEGKIAGVPALLVYNGDSKLFKVLFKKIQDVKGQPGQKQSLLDLGIFAHDWLTTDWEPHFLGRRNGLDQYKLTQRDTDNHSYDLISVNPKNYIIENLKTYNGDKILQKEIRFKNPVLIQPGIWVPSRVEVLNQYGKVGAVQTLEGTKVNAGISDDLFQIS